jgi:hypothetical protein
MMEAAISPETSVDVLQSIECNSPDESHRRTHIQNLRAYQAVKFHVFEWRFILSFSKTSLVTTVCAQKKKKEKRKKKNTNKKTQT